MKKMLMTIVICSILLLGTATANAFVATVWGYLVDVQTRQPIAYAQVSYFFGYDSYNKPQYALISYSDEDGWFAGTIFAASVTGYSFRAVARCYEVCNWHYSPFIDYGEVRYVGKQYMKECCNTCIGCQ